MIPRALGLVPATCCLWAALAQVRADDPAVSIADLPAYRAAFAARLDPSATTSVTFRDLWDHPERHQGRPVQVEGRLARLFRQPSVGQFPPLAEAWVTSPLGEPICVVFPTDRGATVPAPGDPVRFAGTFLRRITYAGGDTKRVAPLIVGPGPPVAADPGSNSPASGFGPIFGGDHAADWTLGLLATLGVGWALLRRHLARPRPVAPPVGPAPTFLDGGEPFDQSQAGADDDDY